MQRQHYQFLWLPNELAQIERRQPDPWCVGCSLNPWLYLVVEVKDEVSFLSLSDSWIPFREVIHEPFVSCNKIIIGLTIVS